jgi:hypothetical protein
MKQKCIQMFYLEELKGTDYFGNVGVGRRIILK